MGRIRIRTKLYRSKSGRHKNLRTVKNSREDEQNSRRNQSEDGLLVGCVALKTGDHVLNVGSIVLGQETVSRLGIFHLQAKTNKKLVKN